MTASIFLQKLDIQKNLNKQILIFFKQFVGNIELSGDLNLHEESIKFITKSTLILNRSNSNIQSINILIQILNKIYKLQNIFGR